MPGQLVTFVASCRLQRLNIEYGQRRDTEALFR
jgi:hypothetical protein